MRVANAAKFPSLISTNKEDQRVTKNYLHFRVDLNGHETLLPSCEIPCKVPATNQPNSSKIWVEFKYKRLPQFCFNCGILNHFTKDCNIHTVISHQVNELNLVPIYGEWLHANYKVQSPMSFFWHMDGINHIPRVSLQLKLPPDHNLIGTWKARPEYGVFNTHITP